MNKERPTVKSWPEDNWSFDAYCIEQMKKVPIKEAKEETREERFARLHGRRG